MMTLAVRSAKAFQNHHERTVGILGRLGYVKRVSISRFHRRVHQLKVGLHELVMWMGELFSHEDAYISVWKRARAARCKKVQGKLFCSYCAAKKETFFVWRLPHRLAVKAWATLLALAFTNLLNQQSG
jgi:hypothetical protein